MLGKTSHCTPCDTPLFTFYDTLLPYDILISCITLLYRDIRLLYDMFFINNLSSIFVSIIYYKKTTSG